MRPSFPTQEGENKSRSHLHTAAKSNPHYSIHWWFILRFFILLWTCRGHYDIADFIPVHGAARGKGGWGGEEVNLYSLLVSLGGDCDLIGAHFGFALFFSRVCVYVCVCVCVSDLCN